MDPRVKPKGDYEIKNGDMGDVSYFGLQDMAVS